MTVLRRPDESHFDAWRAAVVDFNGTAMDGSGSWRVVDFGPDRTSFDALLAIVEEEGDTGAELAPGHVHCTYYWVFDGAEQVGFLALRHSIDTDFLRQFGGHIGYSVRPGRRREGHAARALGLALDEARALGLDRVLLTCDETNAGSAATIESQGGVLENRLEGKRRYWIDLG